MNEVWNYISTTTVWTTIITAIATATITHLFHKIKLRDERTSEFKKQTGREIAKSLQAMNDLATDVLSIEMYDVGGAMLKGEVIHSNDLGQYPSIMISRDDFFEFINRIGDVRKFHEKNLSNRTAVSVGLK